MLIQLDLPIANGIRLKRNDASCLDCHFLKRIFDFFFFVSKIVTPQIRDVTGQRQTYTYASEALTY